jgi:hypothetical protein
VQELQANIAEAGGARGEHQCLWRWTKHTSTTYISFELDTKWATYLANCAATEHGLEKKIGRKWKVENNEKED